MTTKVWKKEPPQAPNDKMKKLLLTLPGIMCAAAQGGARAHYVMPLSAGSMFSGMTIGFFNEATNTTLSSAGSSLFTGEWDVKPPADRTDLVPLLIVALLPLEASIEKDHRAP